MSVPTTFHDVRSALKPLGADTQRRLTIVTPTFYPEPTGTPHYVTDLAHWFTAQNWKVQVITAQPFYPMFTRYPGYDRKRRNDQLGDISIRRVPTLVPRGGAAKWRMINEVNFAAQVFRHRKAFEPADAVLSVSPGVPWAVALAGSVPRSPGARHVALVHDIQSGLAESLNMGPAKIRRLMKANERTSLSRADHVAVLTHEMRQALMDLGVTAPIDVVPLWATVEPNSAALNRVTLTDTIQYSGNFGEKQGIAALLDLSEAIQRRAPWVRMLFRGAGPKFDAIRQQAEARGITNIDYEAPVPAKDLPAALAKSPVHVVLQAPGSSEYAMPSKVVNALAVGAYVVAMTEQPSTLHRLATEFEGLDAVALGDVETMAHQLLLRLRDPKRNQRRRAIARRAAMEFSKDVVLTELETLLVGAPTSRNDERVALPALGHVLVEDALL